MSALPTALTERPVDPSYGVPVPFACEYDDGRASVISLNRTRVTRCALSRICGMCGESLGRPVAFIGSVAEADRAEFHFPPLHVVCAEAALEMYPALEVGVLGHDEPIADWVLITTGGFEFVRPDRVDADPRVRFVPNSIIEERRPH